MDRRCPICAEMGHSGCVETLLEQQEFDESALRKELESLRADLLYAVNNHARCMSRIDGSFPVLVRNDIRIETDGTDDAICAAVRSVRERE